MDSASLADRGVSRQLVHKYVQSGWLEPLARGLFRRPSSTVSGLSWRTVVWSMQSLMAYNSIVGGRTALTEHGFQHYLGLGADAPVHLYGDRHPSWLKRLPNETKFILHPLKLFATADEPVEVETLEGRVLCSSPERAVLELLDELPSRESFHTADVLLEGMTSLRPSRLEHLLRNCRSVKVKRLFFVLADRHSHAWRKHLEADDFDLGSGPRALVPGGKLHSKYDIVVPEELLSPAE